MSSPTPLKSRKDNPYSKRITKENPLIHNHGDGRETRRTLFLRKVREESEERRWDARGGEDEVSLMPLTNVVDEWNPNWLDMSDDAHDMARWAEASSWKTGLGCFFCARITRRGGFWRELPWGTIFQQHSKPRCEALFSDLSAYINYSPDEEMADEVAQQEDAEIEALLSLLKDDGGGDPPAALERPQTPYGSDDEEYDNIFLGVINEKEYEHMLSSQVKKDGSNSSKDKAEDIGKGDHDMMDMT
jgi:hypothetical protein